MTAKEKIGAVYSRVSVEDPEEVEHGSLEQQGHLCRELANQLTARTGIPHRIRFRLIEKKGVSGGTTKREKYQQLLDLIRTRKIDFILAKEISRLSRSSKDFAELTELCTQTTKPELSAAPMFGHIIGFELFARDLIGYLPRSLVTREKE